MSEKTVIFTNGVPQCPHCEKPTKRIGGGTITCAYYPPIYDENGNNTNPDRNTITSEYQCLECNNKYSTSGNHTDGFKYR